MFLILGEYSCVKAELLLVRRGAGRYVLQVYLPLCVLVLLSYALLWCPVHRCTRLSVAVVLFILVLGVAAVVTGLAPRTGDCTALDCWAWWSVLLSALPLIAMTVSAMLESCCRPQQNIQPIPIINTISNNKKSDEGNNKTAATVTNINVSPN